MTTATPEPSDPSGPTAPEPGLAGQSLLDAGADEAEGTAAEDMADAAQQGDARLAAAEQTAGGDTGTPPQEESASRADGAV